MIGGVNTLKLLKKSDTDLTEGVIWKQLIEFAIPMAIGLLFQQLYNTVDTIVVGRFVGKEALAAVGSTGFIINMLVGLCAGLATGAGVVIAQYYGAHDEKKLHDSVQTIILVTFILCVLATVAGLLIVDPMLKFMATPDDVYAESARYLNIYFWGISGLLIYNMGSGILRAVGDSRRPLYFLCCSAVINTVLDLFFVVILKMGVAGVAIATIISQFVTAILVLIVLTRTDKPYKIVWLKLMINRGILSRVVSIGFPSGIQQAITSFSNIFVQSYINYFGSDCMAGYTGHNKIDVFITIPLQSVALATTTFVGQNYGAKKLKRADDGIKQSLIMSISVTVLLSIIVILTKESLLRLFTDEAAVIDYGKRFINIMAPFYFAMCFNQIFAGALRGVGKARIPMLIMLFSFVFFRQIYLYINKALGGSFEATAFGYPLGWMVCGLLMIIAYRIHMPKEEI